ncbi:restriction endonuclease subunit S [Acinetobacter bereziniae]|uniref:restriction endonuclease subunit S n=1 Tax=Acinetobacter bereziniae TaxID=106648 RepID=UPI0021D3C4EB|nr:restriction endonuclease subunit S [Acinetobacter bereziniae]MCU4418245.1 restriction endonuclease subunit S [Acinetobacter bereziniae]
MMFEKYDAYKDSGIDWIGDIPADWDILKLKNVAFINPTNTALSNSLDKNIQVCFLAMENVEADGTVNYQNKRRLASVKSGFTNFIKNDVLVAKITPCFENGKGALLDQLDSEIGFGSTEFHVLRSKHNSHPKFLYYVTKSHNFMDFGEGMMIGSAGQKRVPTNFIENFSLALPNKKLQGEIAKFLDAKTIEIEQVIAIKEQQIDLLNER